MTTIISEKPEMALSRQDVENGAQTHTQVDHSASFRALHAAHEAIMAVLPEITERSITEPYFRDSLLADPHLTINAIIARSAPEMERISQETPIRIVEGAADSMQLVIPPPSEKVRSMSDPRAPIGDILTDAAWNETLKRELIADPKATLARELKARGEGELNIPEGLAIDIIATEPGEFVIALPISLARPVEFTLATAKDFIIDGASPEMSSTNIDNCRYTANYCQTHFTANSACGTSTCITHTSECRRTS